jgi:hypothetical protein
MLWPNAGDEQENAMTSKLLAIAIAAAAACLIVATSAADAKYKKRYVRHAPAVYAQPTVPFGFHQEPARMIEIKPGLYISSYGCVTDEGNGRYLPCGAGRDR